MSLAGYLPNSTEVFWSLETIFQTNSKKMKALEKVWTCVPYSLFSLSNGILYLSDALMRMDGYTTTLIPLMSLLLETPLLHQRTVNKQQTKNGRSVPYFYYQ